MAFGLTFFEVAPGLRLAGDSLAFAYKYTGVGGSLKGLKGLEIGLVDDPTVQLVEGAISGYVTVTDRDAVYATLVAGGLTEIVPGLAIGIDSLSSIEIGNTMVRLACAGQQPILVFRNASVPEITKVGSGGYTWDLPPATFAALKTAAETYQSDLNTKIEQMIADRINADGVLQAAVSAQAVSDETARGVIAANLATEIADRIAAITAEEQRVDALIASGMWLYATQADFPAAAANHGRVVHSHADGAIFYAHGGMWHQVAKEADLQTTIASVANEATARANADSGLSGRLDTLEADPTTQTLLNAETTARTTADAALDGRVGTLEGNAAITDPTTATAVAAVQSDVDANQTASEGADSALSGRLDVLEADPTTATAVAAVQSDVDQNESDSDAADAALSGRLDTLEADPTTATAVAAVQADVNQNEADGDAADAALSGRLDTLEADPTTATAVAAVQADVDQNEADADAALALKAPLADPDFTGQLEVDTNARLEFDSNLTKVHNVLRGTSIAVGNNIQLNPAAAGGRVEIEGGLYLRPSDMVNAADDTAAAAAGVIVGQIYRNGSQLMVRVS